MINNISLAWSFRIAGIISCIIDLVAALLIHNCNRIIQPLQRGFDTKLLRHYNMLLLLAWSFINILSYITLLFSPSDFARSISLLSTQAATVSAFLNIGTAVGYPLIGIISDPYRRIEIAGILTFIYSITCFAI